MTLIRFSRLREICLGVVMGNEGGDGKVLRMSGNKQTWCKVFILGSMDDVV